ncbi:MAG: family 16 glycosylhydrolase [Rikenellaceae bacterium]
MNKYIVGLLLSLTLSGCNDSSKYIDIESLPTTEPIASIPLPPLNQRWVVNEQYTDEFNGEDLDEQKWHRVHPTWIGREPGLFKAANVSFSDGCMVLKGEKMDRDTVIDGTKFNISCAAVISKKREAHYGYYECRFKANKTTLSSTFWLSTPGVTFPTEGRQVEGAESGKFRQELDICECIGRSGDFQGKIFAKGMNANMHYWFTPEGKPIEDQRAKECRLSRPDGALLSEDFNTFGCWWRDAESASFYLNNEQETHRQFIARKSYNEPYDTPFRFTEPMTLNLVVETYPYPWVELPNDTELADPTLNSTLYDWVRSYILIDAVDENPGAAPMTMFEDIIHIEAKDISAPLIIQYTSALDRQMVLTLYNQDGKQIDSEVVPAPAGYANLEVKSQILSSINCQNNTCYFSAALVDSENNTLSIDSFRI